MAIDITSETLFPFNEIPDNWPGKSLHLNTYRRLAHKGVVVPGLPERLKLETIKLAGAVYCSTEAIARFIEAQNVRIAVQTPSKLVSKRRSAAAAELASIL